jgi:hypothetical protein
MDRMSINRPIKMKAGVRIIEIGIGIAIEIEKIVQQGNPNPDPDETKFILVPID